MEPLIDRIQARHGALGAAGYAAVLCLVVLALAGAVGVATKQAWLFPASARP